MAPSHKGSLRQTYKHTCILKSVKDIKAVLGFPEIIHHVLASFAKDKAHLRMQVCNDALKTSEDIHKASQQTHRKMVPKDNTYSWLLKYVQ